MTNDRQRRLMQEALDDIISPDERSELFTLLDRDAQSFSEYNSLQRVDKLLRQAPHERAPKRMAAAIMARVAESVRQEAETQLSPLVSAKEQEVMEELISVAVLLTTIVTMPMLVAAGWLMVHAAASPELLETVFAQVIAAMLLMLHLLEVFLERAQTLAAEDPESALALLALMPATLLAIVQYVLSDDDIPAAE